MLDAVLCIASGLVLLLLFRKAPEAPADDELTDFAPQTDQAVSPDQWPLYAASLASALEMFPTGSLARQGAVAQFQIALGMPVTGIYTASVRDRQLSALQSYDASLTQSDLPVPEIPLSDATQNPNP